VEPRRYDFRMKKLKKRKRPFRRPLGFAALEVGDMDMLRMKRVGQPDLAHDRDENGVSLLMAALHLGNREAVEILLETAEPLDAFEAAAVGRRERLAELLDAGEVRLDAMSTTGFGLLHLACFYGREDAAVLLLDRGASIEAVCENPMAVRPAHAAATGRHHGLVAALLDRGADVNGKQSGGWTLLHHAAQQDDREFAEALLARGADAAAKNDRDQTPADVARGTGHEELAEILA